ncbi:hypothetical protein [Roseateles sp.]|uniref:hypothetical protein n=1 Tax=Roseateles sp. TaxID=1971397 RepID=UPI002E04DD6B|nr:hypothetical protein [Roseateles sp.]
MPPIERQYPSIFVDHGECAMPATEAKTSFGYANFPLMGRTCWRGMPYRQFIGSAGGYALMDFNGNGGTVAGAYFSAEGMGLAGSQPFGNEIVGVYARATSRVVASDSHPEGMRPWVAAVHGEFELWTDAPGTASVFNAEMYDKTIFSNAKKDMHGMVVNPAPNIRGAVGLRLLDNAPAGQTSYRHGLALAGTSIELANIDGVAFCQVFNRDKQRIEFWRGCQRGSLQRTLHFVIPMDFGSAIAIQSMP